MHYGILNPVGTDVLEGEHFGFINKDGNKVFGILEEAETEKFVIIDECGKAYEYHYDDIETILDFY